MTRRSAKLVAVGLLLASAVLVGMHPAEVAADLPSGFTDAVPVGGDDAGSNDAVGSDDLAGSADGAITSAPVIQRFFGRAPWEAIADAAASAPRTCLVADTTLTALAVAPVFKESSAGTSASTAPSPMTLSRYDEWSGTFGTDDNRDANYGLYAFRTPTTPYGRAFWHPGIGIWQYDSAGVGAPFTAVERMDVTVVAADVTATMASRYCTPSPSLIGHGAPFSDLERRYSAWAPWGYPCLLCEEEFQAMTATSPAFANITLVDGISTTGGVSARSCLLDGVGAPTPCWYVDPSVGVIQGATAWATLDPTGGSPTVAPTPLSRPFYVIDGGTYEERHWLRQDTGYGIDISGRRLIGRNARPRSDQPGSGITWSATSGLCDLTTGRGTCVPVPPAGVNLSSVTVSGTYRPVALDADGDGQGDLLWYGPGAVSDFVWLGEGAGSFRSVPTTVNAAYDDVVVLDVDGDGADEVLWYSRASGASYLWLARGDGTWSSTRLQVAAGLRPLVVDTDGDGRDEVFWYGVGSLPDALWRWDGLRFVSTPRPVAGAYQPLVGDFDGDGRTDVFWYAPGAGPDSVWFHGAGGAHRSVPVTVAGSYQPLVGDLDGDGRTDVFWYGPGATPDSVWFGRADRRFDLRSASVSGTYRPFVVDLAGDGRDDIVWYRPGVGGDPWWRWGSDRSVVSAWVLAQGTHQPVVGAFSTGGADGVVWYAPGVTPDAVWWR